ncbi:2-dehydro-3-deoxy-6-phosphogalactonate aldolase [Hirschia litorea]|uniref:2-dehydro-3-deoxy-6-phosphogalactonate aldolase n=1 Tax=Hirschia litorea TaxID=1199156 RepID=A0ABW2IP28_9PROT
MTQSLSDIFADTPIIAILRGVTPEEVLEVGAAILDTGVPVLEVTMNSPNPIESIKRLSEKYGTSKLIGAGTVTTVQQVQDVHAAGGRIIVSPNTNVDVIAETKRLGMFSAPGCFTPSEAFEAYYAGADILKMFPTDIIGSTGIKAMRATLPKEALVAAVGGVNAGNMAEFVKVGTNGFGIGSAIYAPNKKLADIKSGAEELVHSVRAALKTVTN